MSKVLRHHTIAANNVIDGWGISTVYNSAIINDMKDPAGANASSEITSIPSPFARIALVKSAFEWVNREGLDGTTIHHKMVSHCLDIGQILFNYDTYRDSGLVTLMKWDKSRVMTLMSSPDPKHQLLGRTLDLYLQMDAESFNFNELQSIYLLLFNGAGRPNPITVIGATSPATLFVTPGNNLDFVAGQIRWGKHDALQKDTHTYQPLYQRDPDYVAYLFALSRSFPNFAQTYPEVNNYLVKTYAHLPFALQNRITAIQPTSFTTDYLPLDLQPGVPLEINGFPLRKKQPLDIAKISDFTISSTKSISGKVPLVLPNGLFTQRWQYVSALWDPSTKVVEDNRALSIRTLPADGTKWPYLNIFDFLESTIIEMDSEVYDTDFFDGNIKDNTIEQEGKGYLLPIKPNYFNYFTTEDLKKQLSLSVENIAGGGVYVKVTLDIPIKGGRVITFEKNYMPYTGVNDGSGLIEHRNFTMALFPCTRFTNGMSPDYRISYMSLSSNWVPTVTCYDASDDSITPVMADDRNKDVVGNQIDSTVPAMPSYAINRNFDYIVLSDGMLSGIAIPKWRGVAGGAAFKFAVDFGTTNTHIEYSIGGGSAKAFDICTSQLAVLCRDAYEDYQYKTPLYNASIPQAIGSQDADVSFPMRTILSFKKHTNWNQPYSPYVTGNIPFYYGIFKRGENNSIEHDLKWSNTAGNLERIKCYLGSLMLLLRNKVVMEGGTLASTEITWFYPTSMPMATVAALSSTWQQLYTTYFGTNTNLLRSIPESIAPYEYYKNQFGAGIDVLTIDIGGGTSDAVVVDSNGQPAFITSFRFAANALFGDAFTQGGGVNGFVNCFQPKISEVLEANGLTNVKDILSEVANSQPSVDIISFFFSLKGNSDVKKARVQDQLDFLKMLSSNSGAKTLMLIFYTSIMYHMAKFIKAKKQSGCPVQEPAYLAFSGNGSKLLQVLGAGTAAGTAMLEAFTIAIFEKVMGNPYPHNGIQFVTDYNSPKEATSKGGLQTTTVPTPAALSNMVQTFLGTSSERFVQQGELYSNLSDKDWDELEKEIGEFTELFYQLAKEKDVEQTFGTISLADLQKNRNVFTMNTKTRTRSALNFLKLLNQQIRIENTLFFYPITNILHDLALKIL